MRIFFVLKFLALNFSDFLNSEKSRHPHYLLIGNPVGHSVSPIMHNIALQHLHLPGEYVAVSVALPEISSLIAHCTSETFKGANVTIPHKETLFEAVDVLSEEAMEIGAINTIVIKDGRLEGHNTDAYGFLAPLRDSVYQLEGTRAIIFGTGGATKAIVHALNKEGVEEIVLVSRRPAQYGEEMAPNIKRCSYDNWTAYADDETSIIVNATPLGMAPNTDATPVNEAEIKYLEGKICYDIVYNPRVTSFLKQAEKAGGIPVGGLEMLIHQGAESFKLWTGREFPVGLVRMRLDDVFPA